jgi:hypothetical protein
MMAATIRMAVAIATAKGIRIASEEEGSTIPEVDTVSNIAKTKSVCVAYVRVHDSYVYNTLSCVRKTLSPYSTVLWHVYWQAKARFLDKLSHHQGKVPVPPTQVSLFVACNIAFTE